MHIEMKVSIENNPISMNIAQNVRSNYSIISFILILIQLMIPTIEYLDYDFSSISFDSKYSAI